MRADYYAIAHLNKRLFIISGENNGFLINTRSTYFLLGVLLLLVRTAYLTINNLN